MPSNNPGRSSSGSAVAVAAKIVDFALAAVTVKAQREARVRDQKALSFLHQGVDEANFDKIAEARNAKTAWELLQKVYQSADERRKEEEKKRCFDSAKAERAAVEKAQAEARERAERAAALRVQEVEKSIEDEEPEEMVEYGEDEEAFVELGDENFQDDDGLDTGPTQKLPRWD
ncbi:hypothetical protein Droror1_Dr00007297 [Drosera rotundifolia]